MSGGAAKGAVQLYPIRKLTSRYNYFEIEGVSVGAINGAMAASSKLDELDTIWRKVDGRSSFMNFNWWWPFNGVYNLTPLRKLMQQHLKLTDIKTPFKAGIISLNNGKYYSLSTKDMLKDSHLHDAVQASATVVGVMQPIEIEVHGAYHKVADGGFRNIIPAPLYPEQDITHVDIVTCTPLKKIHNKTQVNDISEHIMRALDIMQEEILIRDIEEVKKGYPQASITVYAPQRDPLPSFKADKQTIAYRYQLGIEAYAHPIVVQ